MSQNGGNGQVTQDHPKACFFKPLQALTWEKGWVEQRIVGKRPGGKAIGTRSWWWLLVHGTNWEQVDRTPTKLLKELCPKRRLAWLQMPETFQLLSHSQTLKHKKRPPPNPPQVWPQRTMSKEQRLRLWHGTLGNLSAAKKEGLCYSCSLTWVIVIDPIEERERIGKTQ